MTYQDIRGWNIPRVQGATNSTPTVTGSLVDANGEAVGMIIEVPYDTTITAIATRSLAHTTTGDVDFEIQDVNTTTWYPTDSLLAAGASATVNITASNAWYKGTLTTPPTVTRGQRIAVVCRRNSGTYNGNPVSFFADANNFYMPFGVQRTTTWSTVLNSMPMMAIYDTAGNCIPIQGTYPASTILSTSFTASTLRGLKVTMGAYDVKVNSFTVWADFDQEVNFRLYDTDGTSVMATATNQANLPNTTAQGTNLLMLSAECTLLAGQTYFLVGYTTASTCIFYYATFDTTSERDALFGYTCAYVSASTLSPTGTSDFVETSTQVPLFTLVPSAIDIPTGGGGGATASTFVF